MRPFALSLWLGLTLVSAVAGVGSDPSTEPTVFNDKTVPPMMELTPENFKEEIKAHKFIIVKNFRYDRTAYQWIPLFMCAYI